METSLNKKHRLPNGQFVVSFNKRPSNKLIKQNIEKHSYQDINNFESYCCCCDSYFLIPSTLKCISKNGVCQSCLPFIKGKVSYATKRINPSLKEALSVSENKRGSADLAVITSAAQKWLDSNQE